ncbi:FRG1-like family-domain-containing protein [Paraphysoderma sedebokerense]|nr:FRG1-like family-domain-containing protein [Paraphysoderma sedebokerense]
MSEYRIAKKGKLSFKGESSSSKKKKKKSKSETQVDEDIPTEGWTFPRSIEHISGPIMIIFPSSPPSLLYNPSQTTSLVFREFTVPDETKGFKPLIKDRDDSEKDYSDVIKDYEPHETGQVLLANKLVGSSTGNPAWSLKTPEGRYLSCDKFGVWTIVMHDAGVSLQNVFSKYLKIDLNSSSSSSIRTFSARGDSDSIGFCETFRTKIQWATLSEIMKNEKKKDKEKEKLGEGVEEEFSKKFQSWGGGKVRLNKKNKEELVRAKKDGKLAEALLDRRAAVKSDKYCK